MGRELWSTRLSPTIGFPSWQLDRPRSTRGPDISASTIGYLKTGDWSIEIRYQFPLYWLSLFTFGFWYAGGDIEGFPVPKVLRLRGDFALLDRDLSEVARDRGQIGSDGGTLGPWKSCLFKENEKKLKLLSFQNWKHFGIIKHGARHIKIGGRRPGVLSWWEKFPRLILWIFDVNREDGSLNEAREY